VDAIVIWVIESASILVVRKNRKTRSEKSTATDRRKEGNPEKTESRDTYAGLRVASEIKDAGKISATKARLKADNKGGEGKVMK